MNLNIAFNILAGGQPLEHLKLRRNDELYLNALGAERILSILIGRNRPLVGPGMILSILAVVRIIGITISPVAGR